MTTDTLKPEELRIGNWFIHNSEWSHRNDVRPLRKPFPFQWDDSDWYALGESTLIFEQISPIPLTPEILEKCGFVNDRGAWWTLQLQLPDGYVYPTGYFSISYCIGGVLGINMYPGGGFSIAEAAEIIKEVNSNGGNVTESSLEINIESTIYPPILILYLHQLQNLTHALTQTELQIKL